MPLPKNSEEFVSAFGAIYEDSQWVAERAWAKLDNEVGLEFGEISSVMKNIVDDASREEKTGLIRAHPHLAVRVSLGESLSTFSTEEQAGAGLNSCTPEEGAEFQTLNTEYDLKFGFPFVIAVKGLDKTRILEEFRERIKNTPSREFEIAIQEIHKIASLRLNELEQRLGWN